MKVIAITKHPRNELAKVQMVIDGITTSILAKCKETKHKGELYYKIFCKIGDKNRRILVRALFVRVSITIGTLF